MDHQKRIWIAWETQRRSLELSKYFKCNLFVIEHQGVARHYKRFVETISILRNEKPDLIFVQNPSMFLAAIACVYSLINSVPVVVDRHTTFMLSQKYQKKPWLLYKPNMIIFRLLHRFTIRFASLTIVTNDFLANIVDKLGGRSFVLPDKLPQIAEVDDIQLAGKRNILFITSFGNDEPILAAIDAFSRLSSDDVCVYITGKYEKFDKDLSQQVPANVILTGFVTDEHFMALLRSVDLVIVLTTSDHCMLCGCYEAVAAQKPLITSDKYEMRSYFDGAVFVDNSPKDIARNIDCVLGDLPNYRARVMELNKKLENVWKNMAVDLASRLQMLSKNK